MGVGGWDMDQFFVSILRKRKIEMKDKGERK